MTTLDAIAAVSEAIYRLEDDVADIDSEIDSLEMRRSDVEDEIIRLKQKLSALEAVDATEIAVAIPGTIKTPRMQQLERVKLGSLPWSEAVRINDEYRHLAEQSVSAHTLDMILEAI